MKKIYLAMPYSHPDPIVRADRFWKANHMAATLMEERNIVFSPISHSHPVSLCMDNSLDREFWMEQDHAFIDWCDALYVYRVEGWEESEGVKREIGWAQAAGKEVVYL